MQIATWPSGRVGGEDGPQIAWPPQVGQSKAGQSRRTNWRAGSFVCLSARLENGQLQEDGEKRGQGMEYPPWGLVSCWGRKLLRVKVPPPDTGVWGTGGQQGKMGVRGCPLGYPGGGRLLPQTSKWGLLRLGREVSV